MSKEMREKINIFQKRLTESENLNGSDVRQRFIDLVQSRIDSLERHAKITKQGEDYYDKLQERIDELVDLLGEMKNVV